MRTIVTVKGEGYQPQEYWSGRLEADFSLRGTGHISYSERYNAWLYRAKRRALHRALRDVAPTAALDIGSGTGWVVEQLAARGYAVDGCDLTEVSVERLRARLPGLSFFRAAWGSAPLPRPDAAYGVVTLLDVAYHVVDDAMWEAGIADAARLLRPGGRLVVTDRLGPEDAAPAAHVRFRSAGRWQSAATASGLELVEAFPYVRWLSRDRDAPGFAHLPDGLRGPVEYALERLIPRPPHLRCAIFRRVRERVVGGAEPA